jgi:hypothetical protein
MADKNIKGIKYSLEWNEDIPAKVVSDGDVEFGTANKTNNIN